MSILVITTGGTIGALAVSDPSHPPSVGIMPPDGSDLVCEALSGSFALISSRCVSLEPRDSKLFDDAYREHLVDILVGAQEQNILITHGTDALLATAGYLYERRQAIPALQNKSIILTGAMVPLANGSESDGYLNLKFALQGLESGQVEPGLFIVLCDYTDLEKSEDWAPRSYPFVPGRYQKHYNSTDARRSRIVVAKG